MRKLSRRELAQLTAAIAAARALPQAAQAQPPASSTYSGPLTGVTGLADRDFDPVAYTLRLYADAPQQLRFQARTRGEAEAWQKTLRVAM